VVSGLASVDADSMDQFDHCQRRADEALYRDKTLGRDRICD